MCWNLVPAEQINKWFQPLPHAGLSQEPEKKTDQLSQTWSIHQGGRTHSSQVDVPGCDADTVEVSVLPALTNSEVQEPHR